MIRTSRTIASLIRHLTLGTAAVVATATLATTLVSCQDESQPEYWTEKLEDPAWRSRAIKRLEQFFEDAVTRANKNMEDPEVKALLDKIVVPLTDCYVNHYEDFGSDVKTRVTLIKLISAFRDPRTEPALKKGQGHPTPAEFLYRTDDEGDAERREECRRRREWKRVGDRALDPGPDVEDGRKSQSQQKPPAGAHSPACEPAEEAFQPGHSRVSPDENDSHQPRGVHCQYEEGIRIAQRPEDRLDG